MTEKGLIFIVGGDQRLSFLEKILNDKGYVCKRENDDVEAALKYASDAYAVILPVPVTKDSENIFSDNNAFRVTVNEISEKLSAGQLVIGGALSDINRLKLDRRGIGYYDITKNEEFALYNAFLTAQGALKLLLDNSQCLLSGKKVLVTGFGRISEALSRILKKLDVDVYVAARSKVQLCKAGCLGYKTLDIKSINKEVYKFDYIFNTVPHNVFTISDLKQMRDACVYFELASSPYGAYAGDFIMENKSYVMASALPGKYTAYSAAEKIAEFVETIYQRGDMYG